MNNYLLIDVELTSFNIENSIITSYMGIVENDILIDELELDLIPDDGIFNVDPSCMNINQIDLRNWDGIKYKDAKKLIGKFIRKYVYDDKGNGIGYKLQVVGQDVMSDIQYIQHNLTSKKSWDESVRFIPIDTLYLATVLRDCGKLNLKSLSLSNLALHFGLNIEGIHVAKTDALLTWEVYKKLKEV